MTTRMLIDARHPEETRVAVLKGSRIEEFDFESADHKQIKGNIYLAKVTRVEPSLQAAFVDFGGNRHGFLAFSEIHPDYYQIPKEDRERLLAEEAAHAEEEAALRAADDAEDDEHDERDENGGDDEGDEESSDALANELAGEDGVEEVDTSEKDEVATIEDGSVSNGDEDSSEEDSSEGRVDSGRPRRGRRQGNRGQAKQADELRDKRMALRRRYKIQDVIQRRQVLLVQVVKEERGNKGAALTTYLSLAGRYCVLMPNSSHGGGISRKISSAADRKRLKSIISEMNLPKSMGCIVRTAGLSRTKTEIKRDFDYLARLWDEIRENTLKSSAPALIHSDSDLIKRAIRDIYNKEIEEVVVEGEGGYRSAKEFMKLLMPSHARRVKQYADPVPLFQRYGAEDQLSAMYDPVVQLRSGGYLVINPTEALVSIDINSGRSTKEHGIEATALKTNMEAAGEIARQLRLRDMAGLIVIDFIDMEYGSNVRKVEKAMKDALRNDRARIQIGRISGFGLMEMSRQRLRTGVLEATTRSCPHCDGTGLVRTASSAGLSALRLIEDEAAKGAGTVISLYASQEATIYLLNAKRSDLAAIEALYGVRVEVLPEGEDEGAKMRVVSSGPRPATRPQFAPIAEPEDLDEDEDVAEDEEDSEDEAEADEGGRGQRGDTERGERGEGGDRKRRRRRRGGRGRDEDRAANDDAPEAEAEHAGVGDEPEEARSDGESDSESGSEGNDEDAQRKRRRRGRRRRGGRGRSDAEVGDNGSEREGDESRADSDADETDSGVIASEPEAAEALAEVAEQLDADIAVVPEPEPETPSDAETKPKRRSRKKAAETPADSTPPSEQTAPPSEEAPAEAATAKPARRSRRKVAADGPAEAPPEPAPAKAEPELATAEAGAGEAAADAPAEPPRRGWWQRTFGA